MNIFRSGSTGNIHCGYELRATTVGATAVVSVAITGSFGSDNKNSLTTRVTLTKDKIAIDGGNYDVTSGHSSAYALGAGCKRCKQGTYRCLNPDPPGGDDEDCDPDILCGGSEFPPYDGGLCQAYWDCMMMCPLVIDLGGDGFQFGEAGSWTVFDMLGDGGLDTLQWVRAGENDAFLAFDRNGNGIVDDGTELFGHGTRLLLEPTEIRPNGFVALSEYDDPKLGGNGDGLISPADAVWPRLSLWLDRDADGVSTLDEMVGLEEAGLQQLDILPFETDTFDAAGNWLRYWSMVFTEDTQPEAYLKMTDVYFRRLD